MRQHLQQLIAVSVAAICIIAFQDSAAAQAAPSRTEIQAYRGLFKAAADGDAAEIERLVRSGEAIGRRDGNGRMPLHVATFGGHRDAVQMLLKLGADANALDAQKYDPVTIAAVANDVPMLRVLLAGGASAGNITSPYDGTALIAAAHLGHAEIVRILIQAKAPLDHVNNLGWTALIESIVLGSGGEAHTATLKHLVEAGADVNLADRQGTSPLKMARSRGYTEMVRILEAAGAK
jgi:ankyrin repeat protein